MEHTVQVLQLEESQSIELDKKYENNCYVVNILQSHCLSLVQSQLQGITCQCKMGYHKVYNSILLLLYLQNTNIQEIGS